MKRSVNIIDCFIFFWKYLFGHFDVLSYTLKVGKGRVNLMNHLKKVILLIVIFIVLVSCSNNSDNEVNSGKNSKLNISAASSLLEVMTQLKTVYEEKVEIELQINFGSTGSLVKQIEQGAPVDLFISADEKWMDLLNRKNLINVGTITSIGENNLVLIQSKGNNFEVNSLNDLTQLTIGKIGIGHPESVPAGKYAQESLVEAGIWESIEDKFVYAQNVRQVLTYVETENVDLGFVYASDAFISEQVDIIYNVPNELHGSILYDIAMTNESKHKKEAEQFIKFLQSEEAKLIFEKYGF